MESISLSIRFGKGLYDRMKDCSLRTGMSMAKLCSEAVEQYLRPSGSDVGYVKLSEKEKRDIVSGSKRIGDILSDEIIQEAERRKGFLGTMTDTDFAKLVASRLPKEEQVDVESERDLLSLESFLKGLPDMDDVSEELREVKGRLAKAEFERDLALSAAGRMNHKDTRAVVLWAYENAVRYVMGFLSRGNYPGIGDGGGLSDSGRREIAELVERDLDSMKVVRH